MHSERTFLSRRQWLAVMAGASGVALGACDKKIHLDESSHDSETARKPKRTCLINCTGPKTGHLAGEYYALGDNLFDAAGMLETAITFPPSIPWQEQEAEQTSFYQLRVYIFDPLAVCLANAEGAELVIIGQVFHTCPVGILSPQKKPIRSPRDLLHKRIGISPYFRDSFGDFTHFHKLDNRRIHLVEDKKLPVERVHDHYDGQLAWETMLTEDAGYFMPLRDFGYPKMGQVIAVDKKSLQEHVNAVNKFLYADVSGWKQALDNPVRAAKNINDAIPDVTSNPLKALSMELDKQQSFIRPQHAKSKGLFTISRAELESTIQSLRAFGVAPEHISIDLEFMYNFYVKYPELL